MLAKGFFQIAYVTNDLDRAIDMFRARQGVENWVTYRSVSNNARDGKAVIMDAALAWVDNSMLEIIRPIKGNIGVFTDFLPSPVFTVVHHHFAYRVASLDALEELKAQSREVGHPVAMEGQLDNLHWFYSDARSSLGHYQEYTFREPTTEDLTGRPFQNEVPRN